MGMVEDHLRFLGRRNLRPSTISQRRLALRRLGRAMDPARATTDDLERWLDEREMGPEARACEISHLRGFYKWAVKEGRLASNPALELVRPKIARRLPRPMPEPDLQMAVEMAPEPIRSMLLIAAFAGLRACEISRLEGEHVHLSSKVLLVVEGKGGGMSSVPIYPALVPVFRRLPRYGPLFFLTDGRTMRPHNVSHWCNRYLHSLGIQHTLHSLRHRFGTCAYEASGRDLRTTQELLRHRTPVSTALYTWVSPGHLADAVNHLPPVGQQERLPW